MRAVLVGLIGPDKLFYDLDAKRGERDGIIEKDNGKTIKVDFMSFSATARGLKKLRSSTFHRFLWDSPSDVLGGAWYDSFIAKTRPIKDEMVEKIETHSSLGEARRSIKQKSESIENFITKTLHNSANSKSCCGEMVQLKRVKYNFLSPETRKIAWKAMNIMREIEES